MRWCFSGFFLFVLAHSVAADYYVSRHGNDAHTGSKNHPWQSIDRINAAILRPGDRILFRGGQRFTGNLLIHGQSQSTPNQPITIGSFGGGKAILLAGSGNGITVKNLSGVVIRNLVVQGNDRTANQGYGIYVSAAWKPESCDYGNRDVTITDCVAHDNAGDPTYTANHSGSGIMVDDTQNGRIAYCTAYHNGSLNAGVTGGPCGIWTHSSDTMVIEHCESYQNRTNGAVTLVEIQPQETGIVFRGNAYWTENQPFLVSYQGQEYTSLKAWQGAGQEKNDGKNAEIFAVCLI